MLMLRFMINFHFNAGWVLKAPFTQNSNLFYVRYFKTVAELADMIESCHVKVSNRFNSLGIRPCDRLSYLIMQPCVPKKSEEKVICIGDLTYSSSHAKSGLKGKHTADQLFAFARTAIQELQENTNNSFCDECICRVDMFSVDGRLYVNEFENLQAQYSKLGSNLENRCTNLLNDFYMNLLLKLTQDKNIDTIKL